MSSPAFRFNGTNAAAQRVAARQAARMVRGVGTETRDAIRALIVRAIREGIPPYDAARMIASLIGLSTPQAQAVASYRASLIDSGLALGRVDTLSERYAQKKLAERAENIARFEIMDALNTGVVESARQARKEGLLGKGATKEAIITPDERLCPTCAAVDGQVQPLDKPFQTDRGPRMNPPFHGRCRCGLAINP